MRSSVLIIDVKRPPNSVFTISISTRSGFDRAMPMLPIRKYVCVESGLSTSSSFRPFTPGASATVAAAPGAVLAGHAPNTASSRRAMSAVSKSPTTAITVPPGV